MFWEYIFFISCIIVFYNYAGYAILVYLLNLFNSRKHLPNKEPFYPSVSFIVAAYNEEECIEKKIENSFAQNYPREKIEFIFITDGSTDSTLEILGRYPAIKSLHINERLGKSAAVNRAVQHAVNDILVFSDANTNLNEEATSKIAGHYQDANVGGVAGEKKVISDTENKVGSSEGLYWKYESTLKRLDSDFYSVVGAAGELFSVRRKLYEPVPSSVILDDFIISMKIAQKGFRVIYEPGAFATELPSSSLKEEQKRKVRISAGGFQAMFMLGSVFRFWKQPRLSFLYISHRVLRWTLSPLCLFLALISNAMVLFSSGNYFFKFCLIVQISFYLMAIASRIIQWKALRLAYYFTFMNISVILGFIRFIRGKQPAAWEKAKRNQPLVSAEQ